MIVNLSAANSNEEPIVEALPPPPMGSRLLDWLAKLAYSGLNLDWSELPSRSDESDIKTPEEVVPRDERAGDWSMVEHICGYSQQNFVDASACLPLTSAEIEFFRRNHRGIENHIGMELMTARVDLPSPLSDFYSLYRHRARIDAEAAIFIAQATGSTRVPQVMADLLALGAFANGMENIKHLGATYSVPCAFDTSAEIDRANAEASRRLALPIDHPSHLLKLTPDEVGILAAAIVDKNALSPEEFLEKAKMLSEARQDVNRLPVKDHLYTAIEERDLPLHMPWAVRIVNAHKRLFEKQPQ